MKTREIRISQICGACEFNVMSSDGGLQEPSCLYFDTSQNRLFVGEFDGQRVLVFDNVIYKAYSFNEFSTASCCIN